MRRIDDSGYFVVSKRALCSKALGESQKIKPEQARSSVPDVQIDIHGGSHLERGDVSDDGDGAEDVDDTLVDAHLVSVPSVGAFTAGGFAASDAKNLGRDSHRATGLITGILLLGSGNNLGTGVLQGADLTTLESKSKEEIRLNS